MRLSMSFQALVVIGMIALVYGDLQQYLDDYPACGYTCLMNTIPEGGCDIRDQACFCTSPQIHAKVEVCLNVNCTMVEALSVANITMRACGRPIESRQEMLLSTVALGAVALTAGGMRMLSRWAVEKELHLDDYAMLLGLTLVLPFAALDISTIKLGFGKNIWDININHFSQALKQYYVANVIYIAIIGLAKISILLFYLRIFPTRRLRIGCHILMVWVIISMFLFAGLIFFQCSPVNFLWEGWTRTKKGTCLNKSAIIYSAGSVNITQDLLILFLPIPWLLKLQIDIRRKIGVVLMFSVGVFASITAIIRIVKVVQFRETVNPTWDYVDTTYWSAIEAYVSLIVPCLPAIRVLLSTLAPRIFGSADATSVRVAQRRSAYAPPRKLSPRPDSFQTSSIMLAERDNGRRTETRCYYERDDEWMGIEQGKEDFELVKDRKGMVRMIGKIPSDRVVRANSTGKTAPVW